MNLGAITFAAALGLAVIALLAPTSFATRLDEHPGSDRPLLGREKLTRLHFFMHDIVGGPKPTAVKVAAPNITGGIPSATFFGNVIVIDDPLTSSPVLGDNTIIGEVQGLYAFTGQEELSLFLSADYTFTKGEHTGGSFSVASRNPVSNVNREVAVVGGRGKFRMARGFALLRTYKLDRDTAVIEYNVTLLHY